MCSVSRAITHGSTDPDLSLLRKITSSVQTPEDLLVYNFARAVFGLLFLCEPGSAASRLAEHIPNSGQMLAKGCFIRQSFFLGLGGEARACGQKGEVAPGLCPWAPARSLSIPLSELAACSQWREGDKLRCCISSSSMKTCV